MKKRALCLLTALVFLLSACASAHEEETEVVSEPKGMVYYTFFDTVTYVYSYANDSAERFESLSADCAHILKEYHQLFDIYHEYEGINNLCTLNLNAGKEPVEVDERLFEFLVRAKELYYETNGEMNVMMGSVLSLWHDAREDGSYIPTDEQLQDAAEHTGIELLILEGNTAYISDEKASIDVGAFAKGYATQKAAEYLRQEDANGYVLNVGGNICIVGTRPDGTGWKTAIKDPADPNGNYCATVMISDTSCVTSGVYERYFTVDGVKYHHIIDKDTLYPSQHFASVTVICPDSGTADALSTALFCMDENEGRELAQKMDAQVLWVYPNGTMSTTSQLGEIIEENKS